MYPIQCHLSHGDQIKRKKKEQRTKKEDGGEFQFKKPFTPLRTFDNFTFLDEHLDELSRHSRNPYEVKLIIIQQRMVDWIEGKEAQNRATPLLSSSKQQNRNDSPHKEAWPSICLFVDQDWFSNLLFKEIFNNIMDEPIERGIFDALMHIFFRREVAVRMTAMQIKQDPHFQAACSSLFCDDADKSVFENVFHAWRKSVNQKEGRQMMKEKEPNVDVDTKEHKTPKVNASQQKTMKERESRGLRGISKVPYRINRGSKS